ncbi:MAG: Gfo/Idh/MocA family oxidoreductase [Chitinophagales bacterium]
MSKTSFAVIGCGHIGKRHAAIIHGNAEAELSALCDILPKDELGLQAYDVPFFRDINTFLGSNPEVDVVNICTPNGLHAAHAIAALQSGKHVVIEKPMALYAADCKEIIATAEKMDRRVFCVMQNRFSPPSIWLKDIISKNILGDIYYVQVNCFWNRDARYYTGKTWHGTKDLDGGTLFTQFSHFIDTLLWLFGDIHHIHSDLADFNHDTLTAFEDSGVVHFRFNRGGLGSFHFSTSVFDANYESSIRIIGSKGTVEVGGQYMNEVKYCHIENYTLPELPPTNAPNKYGAYTGSAANHHYIIQNVIDVLHGDAGIATTAMEGMLVVDVIERIYAAGK